MHHQVSLYWNFREPGHMASSCPNEGICHTCGNAGHRAWDSTAPSLPLGDLRLYNNEKACNNCRKTGQLSRDCPKEPICNLCNIAGHMARSCPKSQSMGRGDRGGGGRGGGRCHYRDVVCRNCLQVGHA